MAGFARLVAAGLALAGALVAGPAAALTLTFQMHVAPSDSFPPIADFQTTWTFEPALFATPGTPSYYGDVSGIVETPQNAAMFAVAGLEPPFEPGNSYLESYALMRMTSGNLATVMFNQFFSQGDEATQTLSQYRFQIYSGALAPALAYTPGGFVHQLLELGELNWFQMANQYVGGYEIGGPPRQQVDVRYYSGTARLIAWDVPPESPAVPEPGAWALMILGFGLTGAALRRREVAAAYSSKPT